MPHDSPGTLVSDAKDHGEIRTGIPAYEATMQLGWVKIGHL